MNITTTQTNIIIVNNIITLNKITNLPILKNLISIRKTINSNLIIIKNIKKHGIHMLMAIQTKTQATITIIMKKNHNFSSNKIIKILIINKKEENKFLKTLFLKMMKKIKLKIKKNI